MSKNLKHINLNRLTNGTEVYSIWDISKIKTPIGVVENFNRCNSQIINVKQTIQPDYCECCNRGNKIITYKYHNIHISQLRYKKYN